MIKKAAAIIAATFSMILLSAFPAFAEGAVIRKNSTGDIIFTMRKDDETEGYGYEVIAADITMINENGSEATEPVRVAFDETLTTEAFNQSRTAIYITKKIPANTVKNALKDLGDSVVKKYEDGSGYFMIDAVTAIRLNSEVSSFMLYDPEAGRYVTTPNEVFSERAYIESLDPDKDMAFGHGELGGTGRTGLLGVTAWKYQSDMASMYKAFLWMNEYDSEYEDIEKPEREPALEPSDARYGSRILVGDDADGKPSFHTYNDSRAYTDASGVFHAAFTDEGENGLVIPSGESYINGLSVNTTCGTVDIGLRGATHKWNFAYAYQYRALTYKPDGTPEITVKKVSNVNGAKAVITRRAYYLYIRGMDLYDFESAETDNISVEPEPTLYFGTDPHLVNTTITPGTTGPVMGQILDLETTRPGYEARLSTSSGNVLLTGSDGGEVASFTPNDDEHVDWANIKTNRDLGEIGFLTPSAMGGGSSMTKRAEYLAYEDAQDAVGNGDDITTDTTDGESDSFATVKNDYLRIGYNGFEIMNGAEREVRFSGNEAYDTEFSGSDLPEYLYNVVNYPTNGGTETYETTPAFGKDLVKIPTTKANGDYFTGVKVKYKQILAHPGEAKTLVLTKTKASSRTGDYPAILDPYVPNEPVKIHTPVISPVSIRNGDTHADQELDFEGSIEEAQLTENKAYIAETMDIVQLKLDESYWFTFDEMTHIAVQKYHDESGADIDDNYDEYTKAKYVHFPFDVVIYGADGSPHYYRHSEKEPVPTASDETDGTELTKKDSGGGQYWIMLDSDQWQEVKFYIPPWATEDVYNRSADGRQIIFRVDAQNVVSEDEDHRDDEEEESNTEAENYVAIYPVDVQLSGWVYDFEILGVSCGDLFSNNSGWYSFADNKEEKKTGVFNRRGENTVRERKTGSVTDSWALRDTLTLANGKSSKYGNMGILPLGSSFTFSLKTISNLWDDGDYIKITPYFTFVSADGTVYRNGEFNLYTNDYSGKEKHLMRLFGGADDNTEYRLSLNHPGLKGAISEDDVDLTAQEPKVEKTTVDRIYTGSNYVIKRNPASGNTLNELAGKLRSTDRKIGSSTELKLGKEMRLFTGKEELMKENLSRNRGSEFPVLALVPAPEEDGNPGTQDTTPVEDKRIQDILRVSMQEWFGIYGLPDELYVSTKTDNEVMNWAMGTGRNEAGIAKDDGIFEQNGYLVLHFDITTVNDGTEDLTFAGSSAGLDMWEREGQDVAAKVGDKNIGTEKQITVNTGDIAVFDISRSISDGYQAGSVIIR